jgi:hypothetical protein
MYGMHNSDVPYKIALNTRAPCSCREGPLTGPGPCVLGSVGSTSNIPTMMFPMRVTYAGLTPEHTQFCDGQ